jgi:transposase
LGYSYKRVRKSLKSKRDQQVFDWQYAELERFIELYEYNYIDLFYADACHFSLVPNVRYAWQRKGEEILLPAVRKTALSVFGIMNLDCQLHYQTFEGTLNSEKIIAVIDEFVQHIKKQTILVIDNASVHHSKAFETKITQWQEQDLYVYFLPKYSPELNKIEILWRFIKYSWLPFDAYANIQNFKERLTDILQNVGNKYKIKLY